MFEIELELEPSAWVQTYNRPFNPAFPPERILNEALLFLRPYTLNPCFEFFGLRSRLRGLK